VVARLLRVVRRTRWTERIVAVGAAALVTVALLPVPVGGSRASDEAMTTAMVMAQTPTTSPSPSSTPSASSTPSTSSAPSTEAPGTEVAGKVVDRAPAKVLVDLDQMPRTGNRDDRVLAGAGWLLLGVGLLFVDVAGVLVRRRARR